MNRDGKLTNLHLLGVIKLKNDTIHIRDAYPDEVDKVSLLLKTAYQEYESFISREAWQTYLQDIMDVSSRVAIAELIVAELDGRPVGTVTLYLNPSKSSQEGWPEGWAGIRLLGVDPGYRGRGIGRALMGECLRRCREQSIRTIGLRTNEIMDIARRMYERMGFTRVPEFDFHPAPGIVVMAYCLDL